MDKPTIEVAQAQGHHILVVEDNSQERHHLTAVLEHYGYTIVVAQDAYQALAVVSKLPIDLVVLTLNIAGLGGVGLLKKLREGFSNIELPIIMLADEAQAAQMVTCLQAGANDYIIRPVEMAIVLARVKAQILIKDHAVRQTGHMHKLTKKPRPPRSTRPTMRYCCKECCSALPGRAISTCPHCNTPQPDIGWQPTVSSPWPWLSRKLGGRYFLEQFLGKGSVGQVYRASDIDLGRQFAVKIVDMAENKGSKLTREQVLMEVEALVRLSNPHTVRIYQVMWLEDNVWALVMDFCQGQSLRDVLLEHKRIALDLALDITYQVASALHEAHGAGILHRDIKPANIMLEKMTTGEHFARLLDFGLAHTLSQPARPGEVAGTPAYIAPEVVLGQKVDNRADIYSLGATLYHMLAGSPPFIGEKVTKVLIERLYASPPDLPQGLFDEPTTLELQDLLGRMMARKPEKRFQSIEQLLPSLTSFLA